MYSDDNCSSPPSKRRKGIERGQLKSVTIQLPVMKKKRKRTRTTGIRKEIVDKIECALRTVPCSLDRLFTTVDEAGTPQALLSDVFSALSIPSSFSTLSPLALQSISRLTHIFSIEKEEDQLMLKYRPIKFDPHDCTVYLDILPAGVTRERLLRQLKKFGKIVEIRMPIRQRPATSTYTPMPRVRGFAFVQFTEPDAVQKMCKEYAANLPKAYRRKHNRIIYLKEMKIRKKEMHLHISNGNSSIGQQQDSSTLNTSHMSDISNGEMGELIGSPVKPVRNRVYSTCSVTSITSTATCDMFNESTVESVKKEEMKKSEGKKKKRKRKRNRKFTFPPVSVVDSSHIEGSVENYFKKIQAIPFKLYLSMRAEYLDAQKKERKEARKRGLEKLTPEIVCEERDKLWNLSAE